MSDVEPDAGSKKTACDPNPKRMPWGLRCVLLRDVCVPEKRGMDRSPRRQPLPLPISPLPCWLNFLSMIWIPLCHPPDLKIQSPNMRSIRSHGER